MKKTIIFILVIWLSLSFSFLSSLEAQKLPFKLEVVTEKANIREKPDIGSPIIHQVPRGTILESTKKDGEWYLVRITVEEGRLLMGYVHESLIMRIEPDEGEPESVKKKAIVIVKKTKEETPEEKVQKEEAQVTPSPVPGVPEKPIEKKFRLSIYGGGNYFSGGDLNEGAKGFTQFYEDQLQIEGGSITSLHLGYGFGAELSFPLFSQFFFGIGADYLRGKKESSTDYPETSPENSLTTRPELQATPLRILLSYYPAPFLFLKGGVEYYFTNLSYYYRFQEGNYWKEWKGNAKGQGFGILGALGIEWNLASSLSLIAEVTGRYAKIKGFEGEDTSRDSEGFVYTEEGNLYAFQVTGTDQKSYPQLFIREKKPAEAWVTDPQEARVDFSGLALRLGFRIKF